MVTITGKQNKDKIQGINLENLRLNLSISPTEVTFYMVCILKDYTEFLLACHNTTLISLERNLAVIKTEREKGTIQVLRALESHPLS